MAFNSFGFFGFLAVVLAGYYPLNRYAPVRWRNLWLLGASYVFYGAWDWRFLGLIAGSTLLDYLIARRVRGSKPLLMLSVVANLGVLGLFKYFDFFAARFADLTGLGGPVTLGLVLPVGISFYTFQTLAYTIDCYRGDIEPERDLAKVALYVAFFPQLVAGPIERAGRLLPQFAARQRITPAAVQAGLWLIVWGLFKKVAVADRMGLIADRVFADPDAFPLIERVGAAVAFMVQIYADFSGYTDIARGVAGLMGFALMLNFRLPYLARTPSDFWRRWHVSLSTWLRDYLYIPLGGNRHGTARTQVNLMVVMLLGGLWHGAGLNFVAWGLWHGLLLVAYRPVEPWLWRRGRLGAAAQWAVMSVLVLIGWTLWRAGGFADTWAFYTAPADEARVVGDYGAPLEVLFYAWPLLLVLLAQWRTGDLLCPLRLPIVLRAGAVVLLAWWMSVFGVRETSEFIYFQF